MADDESAILGLDNGDVYALDTGEFLALTG